MELHSRGGGRTSPQGPIPKKKNPRKKNPEGRNWPGRGPKFPRFCFFGACCPSWGRDSDSVTQDPRPCHSPYPTIEFGGPLVALNQSSRLSSLAHLFNLSRAGFCFFGVKESWLVPSGQPQQGASETNGTTTSAGCNRLGENCPIEISADVRNEKCLFKLINRYSTEINHSGNSFRLRTSTT